MVGSCVADELKAAARSDEPRIAVLVSFAGGKLSSSRHDYELEMGASSFRSVAAAALIAALLGGCAEAPLNDIVSIPLSSPKPTRADAPSPRPAMALTPSGARQQDGVAREEALRRQLGIDAAPDGSWNRCFSRAYGGGC
jgi:hypothetical protein